MNDFQHWLVEERQARALESIARAQQGKEPLTIRDIVRTGLLSLILACLVFGVIWFLICIDFDVLGWIGL